MSDRAWARRGCIACVCSMIAVACEGPFTGPPTGSLTVRVTTTGVDLDSNGYAVALDSGTPQSVANNGSRTFTTLMPGPHVLAVRDLAPNCSTPGNPRTVTVPAGGDLEVAITVTCIRNAGSIAAMIETIGQPADFDPDGYELDVDSRAVTLVPDNGSVTVSQIDVGHHTVSLAGVASNCTAVTPSVSVDISFGAYVQVTLSVSCGPTTGDLKIRP